MCPNDYNSHESMLKRYRGMYDRYSKLEKPDFGRLGKKQMLFWGLIKKKS